MPKKKHRRRSNLEQTEPLAIERYEPQEAPSPTRWMMPVEPYRPAPCAELRLLRIGPPAKEASRSPPDAPIKPSWTTAIFLDCSVEQADHAGEEKARPPTDPDQRTTDERCPNQIDSNLKTQKWSHKALATIANTTSC